MTMNTFNFNDQPLRQLMIEEEPWFNATDVCRILGLNIAGGTSTHTSKLGSDEKRLLSKSSNERIVGTFEFIGKAGTANAVNESGLYKLIMRSDKPEAIAFQNWVTKEVLPSVRKTGGYLLNENARVTAHADTKEAMPLPAEMLQMFKQMFEMMQKQMDNQAALMQHIISGSVPNVVAFQPKQTAGLPERDFYFAREVVKSLKLAGATPTEKELASMVGRVTNELRMIAMSKGISVKKRFSGDYAYNSYPKAVVEEFRRIHCK